MKELIDKSVYEAPETKVYRVEASSRILSGSDKVAGASKAQYDSVEW